MNHENRGENLHGGKRKISKQTSITARLTYVPKTGRENGTLPYNFKLGARGKH